jgi:vacuolar-type H+-ATPase subunit C/Vma6
MRESERLDIILKYLMEEKDVVNTTTVHKVLLPNVPMEECEYLLEKIGKIDGNAIYKRMSFGNSIQKTTKPEKSGLKEATES